MCRHTGHRSCDPSLQAYEQFALTTRLKAADIISLLSQDTRVSTHASDAASFTEVSSRAIGARPVLAESSGFNSDVATFSESSAGSVFVGLRPRSRTRSPIEVVVFTYCASCVFISCEFLATAALLNVTYLHRKSLMGCGNSWTLVLKLVVLHGSP